MLNMVLLFIGTTEIIVIGAIALLLFGGKKLPELMRGLGKGVKEFKDGMSEVREEITGENNQVEDPQRKDQPEETPQEPKNE
ncbi:MAG: twin-arginine translocase TatA/TatE family subunit [Paludibacteraceae bacterium]|nr:twin-arginine translocase TatA/TatE family subunit [Paludibacteraceae bacterium]